MVTIKNYDRHTAKYYENPAVLDCVSEWDWPTLPGPHRFMSEREFLWRHITTGGYMVHVPDYGFRDECVDRQISRLRMMLRVGGHR